VGPTLPGGGVGSEAWSSTPLDDPASPAPSPSLSSPAATPCTWPGSGPGPPSVLRLELLRPPSQAVSRMAQNTSLCVSGPKGDIPAPGLRREWSRLRAEAPLPDSVPAAPRCAWVVPGRAAYRCLRVPGSGSWIGEEGEGKGGWQAPQTPYVPAQVPLGLHMYPCGASACPTPPPFVLCQNKIHVPHPLEVWREQAHVPPCPEWRVGPGNSQCDHPWLHTQPVTHTSRHQKSWQGAWDTTHTGTSRVEHTASGRPTDHPTAHNPSHHMAHSRSTNNG
jgi:hypothetical protein